MPGACSGIRSQFDAAAVILDADGQLVLVAVNFDQDVPGRAMAYRVAQRFLHDTVGGFLATAVGEGRQ